MLKRLIFVLALLSAPVVSLLICESNNFSMQASATAPTKGNHYSKTGQSVTVFSESGINKGNFAVYLHQGKKYISFQNTWICIQGKSRFAYNGNWYVIR